MLLDCLIDYASGSIIAIRICLQCLLQAAYHKKAVSLPSYPSTGQNLELSGDQNLISKYNIALFVKSNSNLVSAVYTSLERIICALLYTASVNSFAFWANSSPLPGYAFSNFNALFVWDILIVIAYLRLCTRCIIASGSFSEALNPSGSLIRKPHQSSGSWCPCCYVPSNDAL